MLRSVKSVLGYGIRAKDGDIGKVDDFFFDDEKWRIRYLVAQTGSWFMDKRVLVSTAAFLGHPEWENKAFPVIFSKEDVKNAPDVDTEKPVSRQKETELAEYYQWPVYWYPAEENTLGQGDLLTQVQIKHRTESAEKKEQGDIHLRSFHEVTGYHVDARGGEIGHVDDFIVEDDSWTVRYLVVDTRNWLPGKKVLVAVSCFEEISWADKKVTCDLLREQIKNGPGFDPSMPVNRDYEKRLYDYLGRPAYWL